MLNGDALEFKKRVQNANIMRAWGSKSERAIGALALGRPSEAENILGVDNLEDVYWAIEQYAQQNNILSPLKDPEAAFERSYYVLTTIINTVAPKNKSQREEPWRYAAMLKAEQERINLIKLVLDHMPTKTLSSSDSIFGGMTEKIVEKARQDPTLRRRLIEIQELVECDEPRE